MKTKKIVIAVLAATLLISAALIVGCINPESGAFGKLDLKDNNYQIPPGKGLVVINLSKESARTILPDEIDIPAVGTLFFDVAFTLDSSVIGNPGTPVTYPTSGNKIGYSNFNKTPFALTSGTYNILITAYTAANGSGVIAGWDNTVVGVGPIVVNDDFVEVGSDSAPINLIVFNSLSGTGNFQYEITYNDLVAPDLTPLAYKTNKQTLEIYNYGTTTLVGSKIVLDPAGSPTTGTKTSLSPGYYTVKIVLEADYCQDRVINNVMHIYPGLTSKYTNNTIPAPNQNKFTVKFNLNGHAANSSDAGNTYLKDMSSAHSNDPEYDYTNRETQAGIDNAGTVKTPGNPMTNEGFNFLGWYDNADGNGTAWVIGSTPVYRDRNLYAKWQMKGGSEFVFTFNVDYSILISHTVIIHDGTDSATDPVSFADILSGDKSIVINLIGGPFTGIEWTTDLGTAAQSGGTTFTIDDTLLGSLQVEDLVHGAYTIHVEGFKGGAPYNENFTFSFNAY